MKAISKLLIIMLILVLVWPITATYAAEYKYFSDVPEDAEYAEAVNYLFENGIVNGIEGRFRASDNILRSEFAAMMCRMHYEDANLLTGNGNDFVQKVLNGELFGGGFVPDNSFVDVPSNHWANPYITAASINGWVNGVGNGRFDPHGNLTYEQAIAMLVRSLGSEYDEKAHNNGGWPHGYISVANELGITDGVDITIGRPIARDKVAIMVYNTIKPPVLFLRSGVYWDSSNPDRDECVIAFFFKLNSYASEAGIRCWENNGYEFSRSLDVTDLEICEWQFTSRVFILHNDGTDEGDLVKGNTYYWVAYVISDGQRYESEVRSFIFTTTESRFG